MAGQLRVDDFASAGHALTRYPPRRPYLMWRPHVDDFASVGHALTRLEGHALMGRPCVPQQGGPASARRPRGQLCLEAIAPAERRQLCLHGPCSHTPTPKAVLGQDHLCDITAEKTRGIPTPEGRGQKSIESARPLGPQNLQTMEYYRSHTLSLRVIGNT